MAISFIFHCDFSMDAGTFHWNLSLVPQNISLRYFIGYPVHFIAIFQMYPWVFHCDISLDTQHISLWYFIGYLAHFIAIFHWIPSTFHCDISLDTQHISLWYFKCIPGYFIAIFHWIPSTFHCEISNVALDISLWFFKCTPAYFIAIFHWIPSAFHCKISNVALGTFNGYFIVVKIAWKWGIKIGMVCRMSGTAFRVHCIYPRKEISSEGEKNKIRMIMPVGVHPMGNGKKTKVVALHCSFQNQFKLCPKVLPLWRYYIKDFQKCRIFFWFFAFFSIKTTPNNMISTQLER